MLTSISYGYAQGTQDKGLRLSMTESDPLANLTTSYTYDAFDRLTQASNAQQTLNYSYDAAGNRTSDSAGSYGYNAANELCGSSCSSPTYTYDQDGNLTAGPGGGSFTYNAQNQTTAATWGGHTLSGMQYADMGQSERTAAGSTTYASTPLGLQISQTSGSNTYFLRDGKGNLLGQKLPDGSHWYFLKDGLGSVVAVINGAGSTVAIRYRYDAYGKLAQSSGSQANPWGFAGGYLDSTGLIKFGTRYYDPNLDRWTQPDSVRGSLVDPAHLDHYVYASDMPTNRVDSSGRWDPSIETISGGTFTNGPACAASLGAASLLTFGVGFFGAGVLAETGIFALAALGPLGLAAVGAALVIGYFVFPNCFGF